MWTQFDPIKRLISPRRRRKGGVGDGEFLQGFNIPKGAFTIVIPLMQPLTHPGLPLSSLNFRTATFITNLSTGDIMALGLLMPLNR